MLRADAFEEFDMVKISRGMTKGKKGQILKFYLQKTNKKIFFILLSVNAIDKQKKIN